MPMVTECIERRCAPKPTFRYQARHLEDRLPIVAHRIRIAAPASTSSRPANLAFPDKLLEKLSWLRSSTHSLGFEFGHAIRPPCAHELPSPFALRLDTDLQHGDGGNVNRCRSACRPFTGFGTPHIRASFTLYMEQSLPPPTKNAEAQVFFEFSTKVPLKSGSTSYESPPDLKDAVAPEPPSIIPAERQIHSIMTGLRDSDV
ncbi:hypothetical protein FS837_011356 [Tulasnella sp. UAMH 9824]|nr:hypothetical protein FS837_011356 [Tulasnella sp. UAMH 9824]